MLLQIEDLLWNSCAPTDDTGQKKNMRYKYTILQYACSMHTDFVFPLLKPDKFREKFQKKKDKRSRMLHGDPNPLHTVTTTDHPEHPVGIHVLIVFCIFDCTAKPFGLGRV